MDNEIKELYVKGSIVGQLVGDALGYHYRFAKYQNPPQFSEVEMLPGPQEFRPEGVYSNASALGISTMATLNEYGKLNIEDLLERFYECTVGGYMNYDAEDYYLGQISSQAIKNYSNGMPWDKCGIKDEKANADDDIYLRILPIALWNVSADVDEFVATVQNATILTHATVRSQVCAALYAIIVRNLLLQKAEKVFDVLGQYYKDKGQADNLQTVCALSEELQAIRSMADAQKSVDVINVADTFWNSWRIFSSNQNNFRNAVRKAAKCPNPNTVAGIVGSLVALQTGLNDIPHPWLKQLKLTGEVMETIETFVQKVIKRY